MQCKDIPDQPILVFLAKLADPEWQGMPWGIWYPGYENSVTQAMPAGTPPKLVRAKMGKLIRRGLVSGCACGCRGDFQLEYPDDPMGAHWQELLECGEYRCACGWAPSWRGPSLEEQISAHHMSVRSSVDS